MSNEPKMPEIKLNGWSILVLAVIVFFFWEPLLIIGGILVVNWLIYRNREKNNGTFWTGSPEKTEDSFL